MIPNISLNIIAAGVTAKPNIKAKAIILIDVFTFPP
jgi:hypothetical protein